MILQEVQKNVSVESWSNGGRLFQSRGAHEAKLRGPKVTVLVARPCKSPHAAECRWRRLTLAVTGMHSFSRYCWAILWRHLKITVHSLYTILCDIGNQWKSSLSVGVIWSNFRSLVMTSYASKTDWSCFTDVVQHTVAVVKTTVTAYLPLLPSRRASSPIGWYSLRLPTEGWPDWVELVASYIPRYFFRTESWTRYDHPSQQSRQWVTGIDPWPSDPCRKWPMTHCAWPLTHQ